MHTITIEVENDTIEKVKWLLENLSTKNKVKIIDEDDEKSDYEYLKSIKGMEDSIKNEANQPLESCVKYKDLEW